MFPIDSSVNILKGKQSRVTKGSYLLSLPDGLADILCSIISFGMLCGRSSSPLRFFPTFLVVHFVVIQFSCFSFRLKVAIFFLCRIFVSHVLLHGFYLNSIFFLISFSLTCCQTNKKMETIEKIIHALLYVEKLFYSSFDAKECKHCTSPMKSSYSFSYYTNTL